MRLNRAHTKYVDIFVITVGLKTMYSDLDKTGFFSRKGKVNRGRRYVKKSLPTFSSQGQGGIMWYRVWREKMQVATYWKR